MRVKVLVERGFGAAADLRMARLLVAAQPMARLVVELRQQVEGNVGRLIVGRVRSGNVMAKRPKSSVPRHGYGGGPGREGGGVHSGEQPGGDRLDVAFHARD